ncbi:MAG: T9SS type A sorting domain-containing protein [Bacteroidota bacterium]|nr:T9SS type A sorting domain-containing protein [Bacteroidota bacterium]
MKHICTLVLFAAVTILFVVPRQLFAAGDTLVVYATPGNLDAVVNADTVAGGANAHKVYKLVSLDTTYIFDGSITSKSSIAIVGQLGSNGRPPCIQPHTHADLTVPTTMFTLIGNNTTAQFKNLYLLGLSTTNTTDAANGANATAIQVSADNVTLRVDNVVFDEWRAFAIGYNGKMDKFFIYNSKFRNMVDPTQQYIGEVIRNEWPGEVYSDTTVFKYNTMLCVNGYAAAPVTKYGQTYFEFSHNTVVYTFKNPFFIFNETNAKIENNIFYGTYAGGTNYQETPWWDNLWYGDADVGVISFEELNHANAKWFDPADSSNAKGDSLAELKRSISVKNNTYFWPSGLTSFWTTLNDSARWTYPDPAHHDSLGFAWGDSIVTPVWMNSRTTRMFSNTTNWPGFTESGNVNADPGFRSSISSAVLSGGTGYGIGLKGYILEIRGNTASTDRWGYQRTSVGTAANWVPIWPLPEYTSGDLKTSSSVVGDPYWNTGTPTAVQQQPASVPAKFELGNNYPNPFNPSTTINFTVDRNGPATLKVYNTLGQLVMTVFEGNALAHQVYNFNVNMDRFDSGVYFYRLEQGARAITQKMILLN